MFGIPSPWLILGGFLTVIVLMGSSLLYGEHLQKQADTVAIEQQKTAAANLKSQLTEAAAAKDRANDEKARAIDEQASAAAAHENALKSDFDRQLAERVRVASASRRSCPSAATIASPDPGGSQDLESAGLFVPTATLEAVGTLAKSADETVAAMAACKSFALSVGR